MTQQAPEQFQADTPPKTLAQQQCEMSGWLLAAMPEVKESVILHQDHTHKEPEIIKKIEKEFEALKKEEKQGINEPFKEDVEDIVKEEERIYDREQETEKQLDKLKEGEIEKELKEDNAIKKGRFSFLKKKPKKETDSEELIKKIEKELEEKGDKKPGIISKVLEKKLSQNDVENILKELEMAMMENDVAVEVVEKISSMLKKELIGASVKRGEVEKTITNALRKAMFSVLGTENIDIEKLIEKSSDTIIIMLLGFNGVGKTTTLAKLAHRYKNYSPVLAAGDQLRAARI